MSALNSFESRLEQMVRNSEVLAVARALEAGATLHLGECIEYYLEPEASGLPHHESGRRRGKPYRTAIEQWHLDAARRMIHIARAGR